MTDQYTKIVLTVIAVSLSVIAAEMTIGQAGAQSPQQTMRVVICDPNDLSICANVTGDRNNPYIPHKLMTQ